jgi:hypothetical protein
VKSPLFRGRHRIFVGSVEYVEPALQPVQRGNLGRAQAFFRRLGDRGVNFIDRHRPGRNRDVEHAVVDEKLHIRTHCILIRVEKSGRLRSSGRQGRHDRCNDEKITQSILQWPANARVGCKG